MFVNRGLGQGALDHTCQQHGKLAVPHGSSLKFVFVARFQNAKKDNSTDVYLYVVPYRKNILHVLCSFEGNSCPFKI